MILEEEISLEFFPIIEAHKDDTDLYPVSVANMSWYRAPYPSRYDAGLSPVNIQAQLLCAAHSLVP